MKKFVHERSTVDMLHAFEKKLDTIQKSQIVESASEVYEEEDAWELVERKEVYDYDGFLTDYTLWHNNYTDEWVTIFGDRDLYTPENSDPDMEFGSNEDEARDWFASYGEEDGEDYDY